MLTLRLIDIHSYLYIVLSIQISRLRELRILLTTPQRDAQVTVAKLCMLSLMEVFKDIIPDYRIRPLTETEKGQQVSPLCLPYLCISQVFKATFL